MSERTKKMLVYIVIIVGLGAAIWFGLKWFGGLANSNVGDYDGGRGKGEQQVEAQLEE